MALTNEERYRAVSGQFETTAQARRIYDELLKETKQEIASLQKRDTAEAKQRISELERTTRFLETSKGNLGTGKAIVGGLLSGVIDIAAFPVDIVSTLFGGPSFGTTAKKGLTTQGLEILPGTIPAEKPTTEETAPYFGGARGAVQLPLRTPLGTALQAGAYTAAGAADQTGIATTTLAVGQTVQGILQLARSGLDAKKTKDLIKNLPPEEQNNLYSFMLKGQSGSDPQIAALIRNLKTNPQTAEIMNALEEGAKRQTLSGMAPTVTPGPIATPIYTAIKQKIGTLQYNITGQPIQDKFKRAKDVLGEAPSISIDNTVGKIDSLIAEFRNEGTDSALAAITSLERSKDRLMTEFLGNKLPLTTVEKLQGNLNSFGKATGEENLFKDVARSDQERIASAVFGGLKEDLRIGSKSANTDVRKASLYLEQARNGVKKGYDEYNNFVAQGLPDKLKNINLNQLDDKKFIDIFTGLSTDQRNKVLPILESQAPEAVDRIRLSQYNNFLEGTVRQLDNGEFGVDFQQLVAKYNTLKPTDREILAFSLGSNFQDFEKRMSDASKFFKYNMKIQGIPSGGPLVGAETVSKLEGAVGATVDYSTAKAAGLASRFLNLFSTELKDTDVLKILLTKEGKDFLNQAKLSPASQKTLDSFDKFKAADIVLPQAAVNLKRSFDTLSQGAEPNTGLILPEPTFNAVPTQEEKPSGFNAIPLPE
jgi:hypothetical protein